MLYVIFTGMLEPTEKDRVEDLMESSTEKVLMVEDSVFVPLLYPENPHNKNGVLQFNAKKVLFLTYFLKEKMTLEASALKAGITEGSARSFLRSDDYKAWVWDRSKKNSVVQYWMDPENVIAEGQKLYEGSDDERDKLKVRMWENFADRAWPKKSVASHEGGTRIEINLSLDEAKKAVSRNEVIEAKIVEPMRDVA